MQELRRLPHHSRLDWVAAFACITLGTACSGSGDGANGDSSNSGSNSTSSNGPSGGSATTDGSTGNSNGSGGDASTASDAGGSGGAATNTTDAGGSGGASGDSGTTNGSAGSAGECPVVVETHPLETGYHVTECSAIEYSSNPPCTGEHYPVWAAYQSYDFPVPRGYWVHSLEHGAIVITYNCEDGCADEVAEVQGMIDSLPADLRCNGAGIDVQVILTPDPLLDVRWGLSSWGDTLRSDCLDLGAFEEFYYDHVGQAPEDICGGGLAVSEETLTPGCGE